MPSGGLPIFRRDPPSLRRRRRSTAGRAARPALCERVVQPTAGDQYTISVGLSRSQLTTGSPTAARLSSDNVNITVEGFDMIERIRAAFCRILRRRHDRCGPTPRPRRPPSASCRPTGTVSGLNFGAGHQPTAFGAALAPSKAARRPPRRPHGVALWWNTGTGWVQSTGTAPPGSNLLGRRPTGRTT